jgi:hypothetical protein
MSGFIIDTPAAFDVYRSRVIASALRVHIKTGGQMQVNRAYTPTKVLKAAGELTGKVYKRGQQAQALADLDALFEQQLAARQVQS